MTKERYRKALITGASAGPVRICQPASSNRYQSDSGARRTGPPGVLSCQSCGASAGVEAEVLVADLSLDEEIEKVALKIRQTPDLDLLVINAGFGGQADFN